MQSHFPTKVFFFLGARKREDGKMILKVVNASTMMITTPTPKELLERMFFISTIVRLMCFMTSMQF